MVEDFFKVKASHTASQFNLSDDDIVLLETLIKSPVFGALKRMLEQYRRQVHSKLYYSDNVHELFQSQGRLVGMDVIEHLPGNLVRLRELKLQRQRDEEERSKLGPNPNPYRKEPFP